MKGLKDFLYDKNDILIALIILVVAALLITWRMEVIMEYPQTLAEETGTQVTTDDTAVDDHDSDSDNDDHTQGSGDNTSTDTLWSGDTLARDVTVTVQGGSATAAVQSLIDAGLFDSYDQFTQVCSAAGCKPENIKATTFTFETGSTQADIARLVTA